MWTSAVTCYADDSVTSAFEKLYDNNISGMPVLSVSGTVVGHFDWGCLLLHFLNIQRGAFDPLMYKTLTVRDVMKTADLHIAENKFSIFRAFEILCRTESKRVVVTDAFNRVSGVVTQSMMIGELFNQLKTLDRKVRDIPVREMVRTYWVTSISEKSTAIDGFRRILWNNIGGVAVVDDDGVLVDSLSMRDLKGVRPSADAYDRLYKTVREFKDLVRKEKHGSSIPSLPQYVTQDATLEQCVTLLDQQRIHRLFVVDNLSSRRPIHVMTQTDVLRHVFPEILWLP
jgi:CBS domain-containing protein